METPVKENRCLLGLDHVKNLTEVISKTSDRLFNIIQTFVAK